MMMNEMQILHQLASCTYHDRDGVVRLVLLVVCCCIIGEWIYRGRGRGIDMGISCRG